MSLVDRNVTVLGGGIGGLAAALALAGRGARVRLLEQADAFAEVGAGLQITPNGSAVLAGLGLAAELSAIGMQLQAVELRDYRRPEPLLRLEMTRSRHGNPHPYLLVHRADLIDMLANAARLRGVDLCLGHKVCDIRVLADECRLTLEQGKQEHAEILVAADGLHSLGRGVLGHASKPRFTGQVAWRSTVPSRLVGGQNAPEAKVYMGPKRHLVTYPLRRGELVNVIAVAERQEWAAEGWSHQVDSTDMRRSFSSWAPEVGRLLMVAEVVHLWGLFQHPVAECWANGRLVLLGDACHPTLPFMAQGANMALEDGWVLAAMLAREDRPEAAFQTYHAARVHRVKRIVARSTGNTGIYHMSALPARGAMHMGMRLLNRIAADQMLARFDWLYGHDVTAIYP